MAGWPLTKPIKVFFTERKNLILPFCYLFVSLILRNAFLKIKEHILTLVLASGMWPPALFPQVSPRQISFDFYGDTVEFVLSPDFNVRFEEALSPQSVERFYNTLSEASYSPVIKALTACREKNKMDDWLFYQLIRKTAQQISPKKDNYHRYTLYKWFLLMKSGYDATLSYSGNQLLFYVHSDEIIYNIPYRIREGRQYVCLNYHDYGSIDFEKNQFTEIIVPEPMAKKAFTYKITQLPQFKPADYSEKQVVFNYYQHEYHFTLKLNPQIQALFANYPVVDYSYYFNIPLSRETYSSLIPSLKKNMKGMSTKTGVDYLMRFTRYAFLYEKDEVFFGKEKRLSPEETLLYDRSDCEDRVALFFYLVKEIYNLPMIVLVYPQHVTIAVEFDKPVGNTIVHNGRKYSICEPTPQKSDLQVGQMLPELRNESYYIAYEYTPKRN